MKFLAKFLCRKPGFIAFVALLLALGIGANVAAFSLLQALLLRPFPCLDAPNHLVKLNGIRISTPERLGYISYPDYLDFRAQTEGIFTDISAAADTRVDISYSHSSERVNAMIVAENLFSVLGVDATLGRLFTQVENHTEPVVVISHGLWRRRFAEAPKSIGQEITVNGLKATIIGVTPRRFHGINLLRSYDIFIPISIASDMRMVTEFLGDVSVDRRQARWLEGIGGLAPGVKLEQARARLDTLATQMAEEYPGTNRDRGVRLSKLTAVSFGMVAFFGSQMIRAHLP